MLFHSSKGLEKTLTFMTKTNFYIIFCERVPLKSNIDLVNNHIRFYCILTPDLADLTSDPADLTPDPADLTSDLADLTSDLADLTSDLADLTSDPADLISDLAI